MDLIYNENTQILLKINNINKDIWIFVMNLKKKNYDIVFCYQIFDRLSEALDSRFPGLSGHDRWVFNPYAW